MACLFLEKCCSTPHREEGGAEGKNEKNVSAWSMGNSSIVCNYSRIPKKQPPSMRPRSGGESSHCLTTGGVEQSEKSCI